MTIGTALPPSEILSGIEDKRVVVTLDADIESNDWGFLLALNRKEGGPVIEVIHCGSDKAWAAGYRLALMTWAMSLDFEVREAKSREDLARLGDELWGAGGIRAGRSVCVRIAK